MATTKSSEPLVAVFVDAATGEVIEREFNAQEIATHKAQLAAEAKANQEAQAKLNARLSALGKLADLGLTAEEIAAL